MQLQSALDHLNAVSRPALLAAPKTFLADIRAVAASNGLQDAVARGQTQPIFDYLIRVIQYQGVSDAAADGFTQKHGNVNWDQIAEELQQKEACPLLRSYWNFSGCKFLKSAQTCSHPADMPTCVVPRLPLRKGILNQSAVSLFIFIRDVSDGDIVYWIDNRLDAADNQSGSIIERAAAMRKALLDPLKGVHGVSDKVLGMALADLLLGSDQRRQRWIITGASMIAIDTLVHNFLHRTGVLRRARADHLYGMQCYAKGGCADIIADFARTVDARHFNPEFPAYFPRFLQHAIWRFCAQGVMDVCNGNRVEDDRRCENLHCPNFAACDRVALRERQTTYPLAAAVRRRPPDRTRKR